MEFTMIETGWLSILPPIIAIALALLTKEVYSSLFAGILIGGLFFSGFSFEGTFNHILNDGLIKVLSDPYLFSRVRMTLAAVLSDWSLRMVSLSAGMPPMYFFHLSVE